MRLRLSQALRGHRQDQQQPPGSLQGGIVQTHTAGLISALLKAHHRGPTVTPPEASSLLGPSATPPAASSVAAPAAASLQQGDDGGSGACADPGAVAALTRLPSLPLNAASAASPDGRGAAAATTLARPSSLPPTSAAASPSVAAAAAAAGAPAGTPPSLPRALPSTTTGAAGTVAVTSTHDTVEATEQGGTKGQHEGAGGEEAAYMAPLPLPAQPLRQALKALGKTQFQRQDWSKGRTKEQR